MQCDTLPQNPAKTHRKDFTKGEKTLLNRIYSNYKYLNIVETEHLARYMNKHYDKVKMWFKNRRMNKAYVTTTPPDMYFYKDTGIRSGFLDLFLESATDNAPVPANELTTSAENHQASEVPTESSPSIAGASVPANELTTSAENPQASEVPTESSPSTEGASVPTNELTTSAENHQASEVPTESSPSPESAVDFK